MPSFSQRAFTNSEVESSANAWLRFQSVLRNAKGGQPLPYKTVRLIGIQERVHSFDQSSDGRFLCIIQSSGIRVWNIETPSPTKVGSFDIELPDDCWSHMTVIFESDNSFLLYPVVNSPSRGLSQWLSFRFTFSFHAHEGYQMDLLSRLDRLSFPSIQWYGAAMIPTVPFLATCFKHNSGGKYYVLWDPVSDTCACWIADINDTSTSPIILIANNFIIALDDVTQDTFVYTRPEIPPKDSYAPGVCAWLNNPALLHVPAEGERLNRRTVSTMYWKTLPNRGHLACNHDGWALIHDMGDENWLLERVEICLTNSSSSTFAPLPLACERSHSQHPHFLPIGGGWSGTVDVCPDQNILLHTTSKQRTKVLFHLSSSNENEGRTELGRGVLYDSGGAFHILGKNYSLCLFAGRMCIVTPDGADDAIEVVDFV
ncbi:hypothetical protein DL96DRAFT_1609402 [Flagelloscypha sp. PMI_526]|nr:hypothetical protein DL96DRAFT_1609402 [Flagelloscypha sp. PMI_526]